MMELHIVPCADTLLYLPVYLALDALRESSHYAFREANTDDSTGTSEWQYNNLRIVLHPSAEGDISAIQSLISTQQANPDASCIAIGDPIAALQTSGASDLKVVATFINRIALTSVFKEPNFKKGKRSWLLLNRLRQTIREKGRLLGGEFGAYNSELRVAFCENGETNKSLLRHFLGVTKSATRVEGFGPEEFAVVVEGASDVSFTSAPWLREATSELFALGEDKLHTETWLPSIPYPFSSIVTTKESWEHEREASWKGPIGLLVRHMLIAAALLARYRDRIAFALDRRAEAFRNFGVPAGCESKSHEIILAAVRHLVENDYLAEDLSNTWVAWDFAAEASSDKPSAGLSWEHAYEGFVKSVEREKGTGFWRCVADDTEFWKNDFRTCMRAYMRSDRLAGKQKWVVPLFRS